MDKALTIKLMSGLVLEIGCDSIAVDHNISRHATKYQCHKDGEVVADFECAWGTQNYADVHRSVSIFLGDPIYLGTFRLEGGDNE